MSAADSKVVIWNMALNHLGNSKGVASADESSDLARACRLFWDLAIERTLRDFDWGFARKVASLGLVTNDPTNTDWQYEYSYPSDCLSFGKILSGTRNETSDTKVPFEMNYGTSGTTILTDAYQAVGKYTVRVSETTRFPADFVEALSFIHAYYIAPTVSRGTARKMRKEMLAEYLYSLSVATSGSANEEQPDAAPDTDWIGDRE